MAAALWLAGGSAPAIFAADEASAGDTAIFQKTIKPFLTEHCFSCHGNGEHEGEISFDKFTDDHSVYRARSIWETAQQKLHAHEMPPKDQPQPTQAERDAAIKAIQSLFETLDQTVKPSAGRVTLRRLNRSEYNNTIRDLVGVDFKPAEDFPADDVGYGFDNIGDVLSVSPLLLEKYLAAAEAILDDAIVVVEPPKQTKTKYEVNRTTAGLAQEAGKLITFEEGDYVIFCAIQANLSRSQPKKAMLRVAGKDVKEFALSSPTTGEYIIEARVRTAAATSRVSIALLDQAAGAEASGGITLKSIEVEGPFNAPSPALPESHKRIMAYTPGLSPREAAREIISRFASHAFRRPAKADEVDRCLALYDAQDKLGQRFEFCVRAALYRVLVSPHFLFRVELDPEGAAPGTQYAISEYELASRLSYFLWNSMPDEQLFKLAADGQLRSNLDAQVRRMIADTKSSSFLQNFAEQWLTLRKLEFSSPDPKLFPDFDQSLRQAMVRESLMFFETLVREDRSIVDLLDADFTFVNEQLARHYGLTGVSGKDFVRIKLPAERGGILTQGSILTLTSNATRTSPVKRGKFVLDQILNTPPPPPPADVPALDDQKELTGTVRQIMEQHRANPNCASCHARLDPLGFAFENYDPVGVWRDKQGNASIDASGVLPDGKSFNGPAELKRILREKRELFVRCVVEKMLTYALGRGIEYYDRNAIDKIVKSLGSNNEQFSTLFLEITRSDPFQMRTMPGEVK